MSKGIKENERSGRAAYPDIIDLPHHQSTTHSHMSLYDRAAQFSPFAALTGYDDMIAEEARETQAEKEQDAVLLNSKISMIISALAAGEHPVLSFTVFVPDEKKAGGKYVKICGTVKKVNKLEQTIQLFEESVGDGEIIPKNISIKYISDIHGELVDRLDEEIL